MDFGGPMFGVFSPEERRLCLEWIEQPEAGVPAGARPAAASGTPPQSRTNGPSPPLRGAFPGGRRAAERAGPRRLYTTLLRAESPADCPPAAIAFAERILRRARWLGLWHPAPWRGPYSPEAFRRSLETLHCLELERYRPLAGPPTIGKEFCRWAILQFAPAVLVDGCWLAGMAIAPDRLDETGRELLAIYADELGNGRPERNHANVYRKLLASLGFELPPFDSEAFALDSRFLDAAFDLPVYLLAIGSSVQRYFPELLGLNLAIELSGLGAGYLRAIDLLRYHGIDPTILQLHLSIDNLSSGHAARARDAIQLYLDEAGRHGGRPAVRLEWRRIRTGYLSLTAAVLPLAARIVVRRFRSPARSMPGNLVK